MHWFYCVSFIVCVYILFVSILCVCVYIVCVYIVCIHLYSRCVGMKPAATADPIPYWVTLGTQFANVRVSEQPEKDKTHPHEEEEPDG